MNHLVTKVGTSRFVTRILAVISICSMFSSFAYGQSTDVPKIISYQGEVRDKTGAPYYGDQLITFTLYSDPFSRHVVWQGQYDVKVTNGLFNVLLGKGDYPLPSADSMDRPMWIGIELNGEEEMKPLTELAIVPYAMNVPDKSITAAKLADDLLLQLIQTDHTQKIQSCGANTIGGLCDVVAGGASNTASTGGGGFSAVLGGDGNQATEQNSTIGGGHDNEVHGSYTTVCGGSLNKVLASSFNSENSIICGGTTNTICDNTGTPISSQSSIIGGGDQNIIEANQSGILGGLMNQVWSDKSSVISGETNAIIISSGTLVHIAAHHSTIVGGEGNKIQDDGADHSSIVGGSSNHIVSSQMAFVGGGFQNVIAILADSSFIGGGFNNTIDGTAGSPNIVANTSAIVGGDHNEIKSDEGFIGGGTKNLINPSSSFSFIGGGSTNQILSGNGSSSNNAVINGGSSNTIWDSCDYSIIVGGEANTIAVNSIPGSANYSFLGGGYDNHINSSWCSILGGNNNLVYDSSSYSTVSGGFTNLISFGQNGEGSAISDTKYQTIGGGENNRMGAFSGTIGGGAHNTISAFSEYSTIAGGYTNIIEAVGGIGSHVANYGTIGGGSLNTINNGQYCTIPGGRGLQTGSYAQTVIGRYNIIRGSSTPSSITGTDPVFIIGNGTASGGSRSNAFEVSNSGHSIVSDNNNNSSPPIIGATYSDNVIYAWGSVSMVMGVATMGHSFGVSTIVNRTAAGTYVITLNTNKPDNTTGTITNGVVAATLNTTDPCMEFISASTVSSGVFTVFTSLNAGAPPTCALTDEPFMFVVTGRP